jgi:outer membrane receptor protein involved in Fe transport
MLAVKAIYFDTELWDVTCLTDTAMDPIDEVRTQGFEIEASYAMENGFYTDLNATIGDGEQVDGTGGVSDWRNQAQDNLRLTVAPKARGCGRTPSSAPGSRTSSTRSTHPTSPRGRNQAAASRSPSPGPSEGKTP